MKVLAIGAHFDDVELGCGGALLKHRQKGDEVDVYVATVSGFTGADGKEVRSSAQALADGKKAAERIGAELICGGFPTCNLSFSDELVLAIRAIIEQNQYSLIYTHWTGDVHQDHRRLAQATLAAARQVPSVLMYRSNWYETDQTFDPRFYVDISDVLDEKFELFSLYRSEYERTGQAWEEYMRAEHLNAGRRVGVHAAEAFQVVRYLV